MFDAKCLGAVSAKRVLERPEICGICGVMMATDRHITPVIGVAPTDNLNNMCSMTAVLRSCPGGPAALVSLLA